MTNKENEKITIKIMEKEFSIHCPKNKTEELQEIASYLDQRMHHINQNKQPLNLERLAVITALNLSHELFRYRQAHEIHKRSVKERLNRLKNKIEKILDTSN